MTEEQHRACTGSARSLENALPFGVRITCTPDFSQPILPFDPPCSPCRLSGPQASLFPRAAGPWWVRQRPGRLEVLPAASPGGSQAPS